MQSSTPDTQANRLGSKASSHTTSQTTSQTTSEASQNKTLLIACGAIAHELMAVIKANHWTHIDVQCLPAEWHNSPQRITPAVESKIQQYQQHYAQVFVGYADCGTGGQLDKVLSKHGIERLPGDHCYSFFSGAEAFDLMAEEELGTFYLTDYLVDNFQRLILDGLGISKHPELLGQYFAHYTRLMYLRQDTASNKCDQRMVLAEQAAVSLGLRLVVHDTGLQAFTQSLKGVHIATEPARASQHTVVQ